MAPWWSPLSDGIQRLVGRTTAPGLDAPSGPVAAVSADRPPQTWPWQAPIQRAVDPTWQPRLRPDDFAAGLASHQDPSFRRDLVHDVRPSTGGLAEGLADLVPGPPRTRGATSELTVRPVRTARPEVQRSLASFATASPVESGAVESGAVAGGAVEAGDDLTTVEVEPPWLADPVVADEPVRADDPVRSVGSTESAASAVSVDAAPNRSESVPAGTSRDIRVQRHEVSAASPVVRTGTPDAPDEPAMPVAPTVARTTADRPTVPTAASGAIPTDGVRTLPVVAGAPPARPATPELATTWTLPVIQRSAAPKGAGPAPAPSRADPSSSPAPTAVEPGETAPLSGFAEAIERMSLEPASEPAPVQRATQPPAVAGPVVPQGLPSADVQREATAEASEAPLLGSRVDDVARVEHPTAERATYDDLPVVPVARDAEPGQGWSGRDDVPRLPVATFAPASVASSRSTEMPSHRGEVSPAVAHAVQAPTGTAPLTGTRRTVVQRSSLNPPQTVGTAPTERVQPLRYERVDATTTTYASRPASPGTARASVPTEPALQRAASGFPTVAPGLPGPGPVVPGSVAADPVPALPAVAFPALGSPAVELEPVPGSPAADLPTWSPPEPDAPRTRSWSEQPLQRLAAPATAPARPTAFRSLPFDQMFGGAGGETPTSDAGWTTVDLPVVSDAPAVVQRAVDTSEIAATPVAPDPEPAPAPAAEPAPAPAAPTPVAAAPAAAPGAADLDEMARRLFDPLSARLKAELWLDRERAGLVADARF